MDDDRNHDAGQAGSGSSASDPLAFLARGGEMGARMRGFDWSTTPLGSPVGWPNSLKTVVRILLDSRYAMWMLWGPGLTFLCNDAYLPTVGIRRDWVLGARSDRVWAEIWPDIGPRIERAEGGLGIGLALVKGPVELHGGRVEAESAGPGTGACFTVHLPLAPDAPPPERQPDTQGPPARSGSHARILVADDNRDAAASLATLLSLDGHDIRVANDGEQALDEAERFHPDVALLDIGMPKKNGYEVARELRSSPWGHDMLLVAVTGWGQSEDKRRAREAGFDQHFTKPLDLDALTAFLAHALATRSRH
jgi:CheY-like chemotaxis protein